jgi:thiol-disulfide isomerase/thioredoxin
MKSDLSLSHEGLLMKLVWTLAALMAGALAARAEDRSSPVGKTVPDCTLQDYRGGERRLGELAKGKLTVVAFTGLECPVAKAYAPRLGELAREYEPKGVSFIVVNSNQQDSPSAIGQQLRELKLPYTVYKDAGNVVADLFGARRTPEVFVLDASRTVRYHGRIDDQYGVGTSRPKPTHRDLAAALDELLAGKPVTTPVTEAPGCFIGRVVKETRPGGVTYTKHIAGILQKRCVECHRPGEIGPFSLTSYEKARAWGETIREVLQDGRMPPWHADPHYGQFVNDARMPEAEKQLVYQWLKDGCPQGDPKDLPPPVTYTQGWRIAKPDLVVTMPRPFKVKATGDVRYQYFVLDPGLKEDKWVKAVEARPGARQVVHHILVFVMAPGKETGDRYGGLAADWLCASVPGMPPLAYPDGMAKFIPAGSKFLLQLHYTTNGTEVEDQSSVGLVFADPKMVKKEVSTDMVANPRLRIPPGAENFKVDAENVLDRDTLLLNYMPHTHVRGKAFRYEATYPDGTREVLIDVPKYDFNWQNVYVPKEPKLLPKGTRLHCEAVYDNSEKNPANPNPKATVTWGEQTWEEMMIGYFDSAAVDEDLQARPRAARPAPKPLPELDPGLRDLARHATDSDEAFRAFGAALKKAVPQVDRVCLTSIDDGTVKVEYSAYPGDVKTKIAEKGHLPGPPQAFFLAYYCLRGRFGHNPDLKKAPGFDMQAMSKTFSASVHAPVVYDSKPATVNFWSLEGNAFRPETHDLLKAVAQAVAEKK